MAKPRISVVVPLYNKERYINRALASVMGQTFQPQEVIVVDDGSTDGSHAQVLDQWGSEVTVVKRVNGGPGAARNTGIKLAQGEYVAFLDADDEWNRTYLENIVEAIEKYSDGRVGIYTSYYDRRKEGFRITETNDAPFSVLESFCAPSSYGYVVNSSSAVVPRKVFEHVGSFNESQMNLEDVDMWIRIGLNYRIVRVNKILTTIHYDDPSGLTRKWAVRPPQIQIDSICRHFRCEIDEIPREDERKYCKEALYRYCLGMIRWGRLEEFDVHYRRSRFDLRKRCTLLLARYLHFLIPKRS